LNEKCQLEGKTKKRKKRQKNDKKEAKKPKIVVSERDESAPQYTKSTVYQSLFRKSGCGDELAELTFTSTTIKGSLGLK
jgi:hypothetical protein